MDNLVSVNPCEDGITLLFAEFLSRLPSVGVTHERNRKRLWISGSISYHSSSQIIISFFQFYYNNLPYPFNTQ